MSNVKNANKEAIKMLLNGATLSKVPCPYCHGVRVIKNGYALCIQCGQKPNQKNYEYKKQNRDKINKLSKNENSIIILNEKFNKLCNKLENEDDYDVQYKILLVAEIIMNILSKLK